MGSWLLTSMTYRQVHAGLSPPPASPSHAHTRMVWSAAPLSSSRLAGVVGALLLPLPPLLLPAAAWCRGATCAGTHLTQLTWPEWPTRVATTRAACWRAGGGRVRSRAMRARIARPHHRRRTCGSYTHTRELPPYATNPLSPQSSAPTTRLQPTLTKREVTRMPHTVKQSGHHRSVQLLVCRAVKTKSRDQIAARLSSCQPRCAGPRRQRPNCWWNNDIARAASMSQIALGLGRCTFVLMRSLASTGDQRQHASQTLLNCRMGAWMRLCAGLGLRTGDQQNCADRRRP